MNQLIEEIKKELINNSSEEIRKSGERFFKEEIRMYGLKAVEIRKIGKMYFKSIQDLPKSEIFSLCEQLFQGGFFEESIIACEWSYAIRKRFEPADFVIFEKWVDLYVNNWATCDTLCNHTVGDFIEKFPEYLSELKKWVNSENRWKRRAAAVSLIVPARKGKFQDDIFEIAQALLTDNDDLVQKGYGWMLKVASQNYPDKVFEFVMKHKSVMPRTALRYAIEKMPAGLKKSAMA